MAISTESFTKETIGALEIVSTYKTLMAASTEQDSVYIKAKETLDALLLDNDLTGTEKAAVVSQTISAIASSITQSAMDGAIEIAKYNISAPYEIAKLREDTILVQENQNKVATDVANADEDLKTKVYNGWKIQGELVRDFGVNAFNLATTTNIVPQVQYGSSGLKYEAERQARANVYNTYAGSYRANGYVEVPTNADGSLSQFASGDSAGLLNAQTNVAIRQEVGFDDNMRQHVANSSATMMSMLLSTEASGIDYAPYLAKWSASIDYLNTDHSTTSGTITNDTPPASISIAVGVTLTGTVSNIQAGTIVTIQLTDGALFSTEPIGLVQLDDTWSVVVTPTDLVGLTPGEYNIVATVIDSTSATRTDIDAVTLVA